jgi:hypothetical protein
MHRDQPKQLVNQSFSFFRLSFVSANPVAGSWDLDVPNWLQTANTNSAVLMKNKTEGSNPTSDYDFMNERL